MKHKRIRLYYFLAVIIFYLWYQATVNVLYDGTLFAYTDFADFVIGCTINCTMILLLFLLNTAIVYGIKWRRKKLYRILLDLILSFIAPLIVNSIFIGIASLVGKHPQVLWLQTYVVNLMIFMLNEGVLFLINYKQSEQKYAISQKVAAQLRYEVLRSQVNPHFLFNSLNILYSLTFLEIEKSRDFIISLSAMYRYIMSHRGEMTISVKEELDFIEPYSEVLRTLYYNSLEIEIKGKENVSDQRIVPYSLQLLMENVIKHNVVSCEYPMKVEIEINRDGIVVRNMLRVKDDELKSDMEKSTGTGLKYLKELVRRNGKECIVKKTDEIFEVKVPFIDIDNN
ncbi:MAG: histidine kinase [Prevotella sp.]|nr:histidine kinase [Prevotella sp.]MCM1075462.1 histidine kinase [Ruminococcus sp.]